VDELAGLYRSLLADRAILVVLDDALDEAQVRPLLPGGGRSGVLITSRGRLVGLEGATLLDLDVLGIDEAVELLARVAGSERVAAELGAARDIARLCGGLPLAVRTAGARLAGRVSWPIAHLADRLRDERQRLDELTAGDLEVRASLALSLRTLRADERAAFRRLGLIGVSEFGGWLLGPLLDVPPPEAARLAERLTDAQLVDPAGFDGTGQSRYRLHDLLRVYGAELAETEESRADRCATLGRTVRSWLWLVNRAAQLSAAGTLQLDSDAADEPDLDPEIVRALQRNPRAWFETEHATLAEVVARATDLDPRAVASGLATALLTWPLAARRQFERWSGAHEAALLALRRAGDGPGEARLLVGLGKLRSEQDRFAEARSYLADAESAFGALADRHGVATVQSILGKLAVEQGRYAEAAGRLDAAREFFVETGHQVGIANVERTLGRIHREQGRFDLAMSSFQSALAVYQQVGSARGEAITRNGIAMVHRGDGSLCRAAEEFELAAELLERVGDRLTLTYTRQDLAKVRIRQGRLGSVRGELDRSLELCRSLDDRFGQALVLRTLGALEIALGDGPAAVQQLALSLAIWRAIDLPLFAARARRDLAAAHQLMGNRYAATCCWSAALETFRAFGAREWTEMTMAAGRGTLGVEVGVCAALRPVVSTAD
jgi:tetratricopeptide (TPR) repeat protein